MSAKSYERRNEILSLLRDHDKLRVADLASRLGVSQGTIRNDLNYLAENGLVKRRHGVTTLAMSRAIADNGFAERARANVTSKRLIARRAADIVKDGDAIFLDDSTTAYAMIPYLHDRRDLTIVTNGIEAALAAAQIPGATVMLLGGIVRAKTVSVFGHLSSAALDGLHIKRAFVSCSGLTARTGFTEGDMEIAQLKAKVVQIAEQTIALVESSKFGVVQIISFAQVSEVAQILTDPDVEPAMIEQLQAFTTLTVCGEITTTSYTRQVAASRHYRIGFANLGEDRPFPVAVRKSLEAAARDSGCMDIIVGDNQHNSDVAIEVADYLIRSGIDLAIEYHYEERVGPVLMSKFRAAGVPVIAVDIPIVGAVYFGLDNYRVGYDGGTTLGRWIKKHWKGTLDYLIVIEVTASGPIPAVRVQAQLDGLRDVIGPISPAQTIRLEDREIRVESMISPLVNALTNLPSDSRIAVVSSNDTAVEALISAVQETRRERNIVCVSAGTGSRRIRDELRRPNSIIVSAILFPPEQYGSGLVDLARRILRGEPVPPAVYIEHRLVDADNLDSLHSEQ